MGNVGSDQRLGEAIAVVAAVRVQIAEVKAVLGAGGCESGRGLLVPALAR